MLQAASTLNAPIVTLAVRPQDPARYSFPNLSGLSIIGTHTQPRQDGVVVSAANGKVLDVLIDNVGIFDTANGLNAESADAKIFVRESYFENCTTGIRLSDGNLTCTQCYFFGNTLQAVNATGTGSFCSLGCWYFGNRTGAIILTANGAGFSLIGNQFHGNGGPSAPTVAVGTENVSAGCVIANNMFGEIRTTGALVAHLAINGANSGLTATGNTFLGAPAITVAATAGISCIIESNVGWNNTAGIIAKPFHPTLHALAPYGTSPAPSPSTTYQATIGPIHLSATGGTAVAITLLDPNSRPAGPATPTFTGVLPAGWSINFGAFTAEPAVTAAIV